MLFLNFFLPAALLSNQRDFESQRIYLFLPFMANVSQSMSSGHIMRMYSFLEEYWNPALASSFFLNIEKSCPQSEFLDKKWLEFLPEGQILSVFGTWVFAKMLKKKACNSRFPSNGILILVCWICLTFITALRRERQLAIERHASCCTGDHFAFVSNKRQ